MVECGYQLESSDPPQCNSVKLKDQRSDLQEQGLLRMVTELFLRLIGGSIGSLVDDSLEEDENGAPEGRHVGEGQAKRKWERDEKTRRRGWGIYEEVSEPKFSFDPWAGGLRERKNKDRELGPTERTRGGR